MIYLVIYVMICVYKAALVSHWYYVKYNQTTTVIDFIGYMFMWPFITFDYYLMMLCDFTIELIYGSEVIIRFVDYQNRINNFNKGK